MLQRRQYMLHWWYLDQALSYTFELVLLQEHIKMNFSWV